MIGDVRHWRFGFAAWRFRVGAWNASLRLWRSTLRARAAWDRPRPLDVMIDNSVLAYGVTHETAWIDCGVVEWSGKPVSTGFAARVPLRHESGHIATSARYLHGIADLSRRKFIALYSTPTLMQERKYQPHGRFSGYTLFSLSAFEGIPIRIYRDLDLGISDGLCFSNIERGLRRDINRAASSDGLLRLFIDILGEKNNQDAKHLVDFFNSPAEYFLTMDFALIKSLRSRLFAELAWLGQSVLSPEELGAILSIRPLDPAHLSYLNASFPVEGGAVLHSRRPRRD